MTRVTEGLCLYEKLDHRGLSAPALGKAYASLANMQCLAQALAFFAHMK